LPADSAALREILKGNIMKQIPGFSNYFVTKSGKVYSKARGDLKQLKPCRQNNGYLYITPGNGKRRGAKKYSVQSLVLLTFIGSQPKGMEICHNNDIRTDNRLSNLRYDTRSGNYADRVRHGTDNQGIKHGNSKLNEWQVRIINRCKNVSNYFLGRLFGVNSEACRSIRIGRNWTHLTLKQR
jgi:hypothetical protein